MTSGDLNGDKINDLVTVLEYKDTVPEERSEGRIFVTTPRILLIFFKNIGGTLDLKLQHNTFLFRKEEDATGANPILKIKNGVLSIHYDLFHDYPTYKFSYRNNDFYLIGANISGIHGGEWSEEKIDLSTKKFYRASYILDNEKEKKVQNLNLKNLKPLKFKEYKMPLTYQITKDYLL